MNRRLRVVQLVVQPVVVWDDGEELSPGPKLDPIGLPLSGVTSFLDGLPDQLIALADKLNTPQDQ